jgi:hypothetical protein
MILNDFAPKDIRDKLAVCCKDNIKYLRDNQKREIFDKLITKVKMNCLKKMKLINHYIHKTGILIFIVMK